MGYNINLVKILGDFNVTCPHCNLTLKASDTHLTDIDVEGTNFNPENGVWNIEMRCYLGCDKDYSLRITVIEKHVQSSCPSSSGSATE